MLNTKNMLSQMDPKIQISETDMLLSNQGSNISEQIHCSTQSKDSKKVSKQFSHTKQNKDGANAARTARITLISMILSLDKKGVTQILRMLNENSQIKKVMLNIGQRDFYKRFLLKPELRSFFSIVFQNISLENVDNSMRKNKRSQLNYQARLQLCYKYIMKYKKYFDEQFSPQKKQQFQEKHEEKQILFIPIALRPEEYQLYMSNQGFFWFM